jgi:hypothetical protein
MARGALKTYKSYLFRDKDPIIDRLRTAVADSGLSMKKLQEISSVSNTTTYNWFNGKTKRPQFCTVSAVARAAGKKGIRWSGKNGAPELID